MWAAVMFGRYLSSHSGNREFDPCRPRRSACSLPDSSQALATSEATSGRSMGIRPEPMTTPRRSGFSRDRSRPESRTASPAAATPKRAARPMIFRLLRWADGTYAAASNSGTSPATRTGCSEASKQRMGPMPLRPSTHADQKASLPMPFGATTPTPVTTTLRMASLRGGAPVASPGAGAETAVAKAPALDRSMYGSLYRNTLNSLYAIYYPGRETDCNRSERKTFLPARLTILPVGKVTLDRRLITPTTTSSNAAPWTSRTGGACPCICRASSACRMCRLPAGNGGHRARFGL